MRRMSTARRTAVVSLVAAICLAFLKLVVGFASGSLGILAEAVHSGIDAAAAGLTVYAVGVAERPADPEHPFGHGKAQHLAALAEATFLAAAATWIAVEALLRLSEGSSPVEAPWYAFAALVAVLAVDAGRAGISLRQGRLDRNAALIANAWHFGSDFEGTLAVLVGLALVAAGVPAGDSLAAIFVAAIVLLGALRLARQNVDALMDRTPSGVAGRVETAARSVPGVSDVRSVRVREAGGESFAEVVIGVPRLAGVEREHDGARVAAQGRAVVGQRARRRLDHLARSEPLLVVDVAEDPVHQVDLRDPAVACRVADHRHELVGLRRLGQRDRERRCPAVDLLDAQEREVRPVRVLDVEDRPELEGQAVLATQLLEQVDRGPHRRSVQALAEDERGPAAATELGGHAPVGHDRLGRVA